MIAQSNHSHTPNVIAARWAVTLCEPLISTRKRIQLDEEMMHLASSDPQWLSIWFSGVIADHIATLPAEDPWRNLTIPGTEPSSNDGTVLLPSGAPFGGPSSWNDLLNQNVADASTDVAVAAIADGLAPESSMLVAQASNGWESARDYIDSMFAAPEEGHPIWMPKHVFATAADALRWVMHRRRTYTGPDDVFSVLSLFGWLHNADRISKMQLWEQANSTELLDDQKIADGSWERFRINV